ncbi:MAG: serine hydrolase [Cyclobacteriaceae bacterium]|nr:serine hydrolase [Cyclobacteriaceae bacterium]
MKITYILLFIFLLVGFSCKKTIVEDEQFLRNLMETQREQFIQVLDSANVYDVQIIYTQINRDEKNIPAFKSFYYNFDSSRYFYPASTIKFPSALLALDKLNTLSIPHLDKYTPMHHDSVYAGQRSVWQDTTSENYMPSVAHYIKKILVVSDNDAYNRLYEWVGPVPANNRLRELGYASTRMIHRLERPLTPDENAQTEAITFFQKDKIVYKQEGGEFPAFVPKEKILRGKGFIKNDSLVKQAFDFSYKNFFPLHEQQNMLKAILFPESKKGNNFNLTEDDRKFLLQYMSQLPTETSYPPYNKDTTYYTDAYCKFFMFGGKGTIPDNIRILNKVGDAYGYLLDNAYIVDFENNIEFMVTAYILCNKDEVFNDGIYDYDRVGFPFFKNLGRLLHQYELQRSRKVKPNLSAFKVQYDN